MGIFASKTAKGEKTRRVMLTREKKPQLIYPLLNQLAEKVVLVAGPTVDIGHGVRKKLKKSTPLKLMFTSPRCKNAVLTQFSRMAELVVLGEHTWLYRRITKRMSDYYTGESIYARRWFIALLLDYGCLRVRSVAFAKGCPKKGGGDDGGMRAVDLLWRAMGFEETAPGLSKLMNDLYRLERVCADFRDVGDLDRIRAFKTKEVRVRLEYAMDPIPPTALTPRVRFPETRIASVYTELYEPDQLDNEAHLLGYILDACPNLFTLSVTCKYCPPELIGIFRDEIYPRLAPRMSTAVGVTFTFELRFPTRAAIERLCPRLAEMFPAEERPKGEEVIRRSMRLAEEEGKRPWEIRAVVYEDAEVAVWKVDDWE